MSKIALTHYEYELINELTESLSTRVIPDVMISCAEAARILGVTPNTICNYLKQKRLVKKTIDGVTGIRLADVILYKERHNPSRDGGAES